MLVEALEKIRNKIIPILNYSFGIEPFDFYLQNPIIMSFDINQLNSEHYKYIYSKIFTESIKKMNLKNQKLIKDFFSNIELNDHYRNDFIKITLTEYIYNLTDSQRKDLSDSGIVTPYFSCIITDNYNCFFNPKALCIGTIKIFISTNDFNVKINWNKMSTISSLVPLILIINTYEYFNHMYLQL